MKSITTFMTELRLNEPCEDCVSRDLMYKLGAKCIAVRNEDNELVAITSIESLPSVTPKQKTGKWMKTGQSFLNPNKFRNYFCSECGSELDKNIRVELPYCPYCGIKMEGGT